MPEGFSAALLLLPLVVYLSLSRLAPGRAALIGIGFAAVVVVLAALGAAAMRPLALVALPGIAAAALVQGIRVLAGPRLTRGGYLALVGLPVVAALAWLLAGGA